MRRKRKLYHIYKKMEKLFQVFFFLCMCAVIILLGQKLIDNHKIALQKERIAKEIYKSKVEDITKEKLPKEDIIADEVINILPEYQSLYNQNPDMIGWLKVDDTIINYPVMQTMDNEDYYLDYDFSKEKNSNGSLILDTDSSAGIGTNKNKYSNGTAPSTNLIIHGHTTKSGLMFGGLNKYKEKSYGLDHKRIFFNSLYEKREYELIAVFYSQVYMSTDQVFKYYKFFQADTLEEFNDWSSNIKKMSLYDTGTSLEFGDEFITLSCCSYQVEDGRFVVVGKRVN